MANPNKLCESKWKQRTHDTHQQHLESLKERQNTKVLLLGSSMMERFHTTGVKYKEKFFEPRNVTIAGVGGDGVQHMLYRVEQGLLEACPEGLELIVLQAGTNNIENSNPEQVANGVQNLVNEIQKRKPNIRIVVFGLCPRKSSSKKVNNQKLFEKVKAANSLLANTNNINAFVDVFDEFLKPNGDIDPKCYADIVHFSAIGYGKFAKAIVSAIDTHIQQNSQ